MTKDIRPHHNYMHEHGSHKVLPGAMVMLANDYLYPCGGKLQWCRLQQHWWQFTYPLGIMT